MPDRSERPLLSRSDNQERSVHYTRESRDSPPDGAFMEPRGCNRWQSAANRLSAQTAETRQKPLPWVATGCLRRFHGKQGVCRGLPPVAGGPLPAREGVDTYS